MLNRLNTPKAIINESIVNSKIVKSVDELLEVAKTAKDGQKIELQDGGRSGTFTYDSSRKDENDGIIVLNGWVRFKDNNYEKIVVNTTTTTTQLTDVLSINTSVYNTVIVTNSENGGLFFYKPERQNENDFTNILNGWERQNDVNATIVKAIDLMNAMLSLATEEKLHNAETIDELIVYIKSLEVKTDDAFNVRKPIINKTYGVEYFIDNVNGNNTNDGLSLANAFSSIPHANTVISNYITNNGLPNNGFVVWIRGGRYEQLNGFNIQTQGSKDAPIHYRPYNNENVIISGGKLLDNSQFTLVTSSDVNWDRLNTSSRDNIYVYDLDANGVSDLGSIPNGSDDLPPPELVVNNKMQYLPRFPKFKANKDVPSLDSNIINITGDNLDPDISGTYTKQNTNLWKKDDLVGSDQYYIVRDVRNIGTEEQSWHIQSSIDPADTTQVWSSYTSGKHFPFKFSTPRGGANGSNVKALQSTAIVNGRLIVEGSVDDTHFTYNDTLVPDTWVLGDVYYSGAPEVLWRAYNSKITAIDTTAKTIETTRAIKAKKDSPYFILNVLEELTIPGEYYIDRTNKLLYYYPTGDITTDTIELTHNTEYNGLMWFRDAPRHTSFIDLTISNARRALLKTHDAEYCKFINCTLSNSGQILFSIRGYNNTLEFCKLTETGGKAGYISGGDIINLVPSNNGVLNSWFTGERRWFTKNGNLVNIVADSCGGIFKYNQVTDLEAGAVDNGAPLSTIAYNYISNVDNFNDDSAAIYGGEWKMQGTQISNNFICDMINRFTGTMLGAIYCDFAGSGTIIENNILADIENFGIYLHGGWGNIMDKNIFYNVEYPLYAHIDSASSTYITHFADAGIDYQAEPWASKFPLLVTLPKDYDTAVTDGWWTMKYNKFTNNIAKYYRKYTFANASNTTNNFEIYDVGPVDKTTSFQYPIRTIGIQKA